MARHTFELRNHTHETALALAGTVGLLSYLFSRKVMRHGKIRSLVKASAVGGTALAAMRGQEIGSFLRVTYGNDNESNKCLTSASVK